VNISLVSTKHEYQKCLPFYKHLTNLANFRRFFVRKIVDFDRSQGFLRVIAILFIKSAVIFKGFLSLN